MPVIKISEEQITAVGASNVAEFPDKLSAFIKQANENKIMVEQTTSQESERKAAEDKKETDSKSRESQSMGISEDRAKQLIREWAATDEAKKLFGAEASRITMEALANVGTQPAKPAPTGEDPAKTAKGLVEAGKFEEAWALDQELQAEFPTAKVFAAYAKAAAEGRVTVGKTK